MSQVRPLLTLCWQILSGRGDGELAVFDAFGGDEFVGQFLDGGGFAADSEHFKAVVVVEVAVQRWR